MAKTLLRKGDVYGQQFVVYYACQAYPAYVVTYTCPDDFSPSVERSPTQVPMNRGLININWLEICVPVYHMVPTATF